MIAHRLPIYAALERVDMRLGAERLGGLIRERMGAEPRSRALFVCMGKRRHTMKVVTWDGTGMIVIHKKLDAATFELPRAWPACGRQRRALRDDLQGPQHKAASDADVFIENKGLMRVLCLRQRNAFVYSRDAPRTTDGDQPTLSATDLTSLVLTLQVELLGLKSHVTARDTQIDSLPETILNLTHENELLKRRIYGNKTERTSTSELQLALGGVLDGSSRRLRQVVVGRNDHRTHLSEGAE